MMCERSEQNMEIGSAQYGKSFAEGGVTFLLFQAQTPKLSEDTPCAERVNAFYRAICERTEKYIAERYLPFLREAYEEDPDPRKRFTHRLSVVMLTCEARIEGSRLVVGRTVRLRQGARITEMDKTTDIFDTDTGLFCRNTESLFQKIMARILTRKGTRVKKHRGFLFARKRREKPMPHTANGRPNE